jgi:hypothetical protein
MHAYHAGEQAKCATDDAGRSKKCLRGFFVLVGGAAKRTRRTTFAVVEVHPSILGVVFPYLHSDSLTGAFFELVVSEPQRQGCFL